MSSLDSSIVQHAPHSDIYSAAIDAAHAQDADGAASEVAEQRPAIEDSFQQRAPSEQQHIQPPPYLSSVVGLPSPAFHQAAPLNVASSVAPAAPSVPPSPASVASVASEASAASDVSAKKSMKPVTVMAATTAVLLGIGGGVAAYFTSPLWIPVIVGLFAHPFGAFVMGGVAVAAAVALIAVVTYVIVKRVNARKEAERVASNGQHAPLLANAQSV